MTLLIPSLVVVVLHFVGDFVFQSRWIANNKSAGGKQGLLALAAHFGTYGFALWLFGAFLYYYDDAFFDQALNDWSFQIWWFGNIVVHVLQDAITSRLTSKFYKEEKEHAFFITIGLDQTMHYIVLLVSLAYFLKLS